jgi:penicillin-binding protein 1A
VPNLAAGVWVGNEDRSAHFENTSLGQGATMALPIYGIFMRKCLADSSLEVSQKPFDKPQNMSIDLDCRGDNSGGGSQSTDSTAVDSLAVPTEEIEQDTEDLDIN